MQSKKEKINTFKLMCPHTQIAELIRKYSKDLRINNFTRTGSNIQRGNLVSATKRAEIPCHVQDGVGKRGKRDVLSRTPGSTVKVSGISAEKHLGAPLRAILSTRS